LIAITVTGSFRSWERFMYVLILANLIVVPLAFMGHPHWGQVAHDWFVPGIQGGLTSTAVLLIIGIVGTTVAPWQLFFQQSNVVDKRLTPRWYRFEFADTAIGAVLTVMGATGLMLVCGFAFAGTKLAGQFTDAGAVAQGLAANIGPLAGGMFALFLIDASLIGAAAVTLSTSYAFGDVFEIKHSLHRGLWSGRAFYAIYSVLIAAAAAIVLIPNAPLGVMTLAVQVLAGVLLPSAIVFLLLLCNDKAVLGPWVNKPWLNVVASLIVGVLVALSLILAGTVLFPTLDAVALTKWLAVALVLALVVIGAILLRRQRRMSNTEPILDRANWQMPPLSELAAPANTAARNIGLLILRGYLILAAVLVMVKFAQTLLGHG
jgi:Mn2+/Fe2+ NRAMP family transporter